MAVSRRSLNAANGAATVTKYRNRSPDGEAFDAFYTGYFPRLYRFARTRLKEDQEIIKEIVHVTLSKAIRELAAYRGEAGLFTWLCTICRREVADYVERVAREREHVALMEDTPDVRAALDALAAPASEEPDAQFRHLETTRLIQDALDRLPARYGDALEWKYVYGFSIQEIADQLGTGLEGTQSILARAKRAFHEVYGALTRDIVQQSPHRRPGSFRGEPMGNDREKLSAKRGRGFRSRVEATLRAPAPAGGSSQFGDRRDSGGIVRRMGLGDEPPDRVAARSVPCRGGSRHCRYVDRGPAPAVPTVASVERLQGSITVGDGKRPRQQLRGVDVCGARFRSTKAAICPICEVPS
jgi:RNA polymerase sigma-70 factor (ECF subfamily)